MGVVKDIAGQRFGKLIVIERSFPNVDNYAMWKCKCDCGGEIITKGRLLRAGKVKSCGCLQKMAARDANIIDLTGQKFNRLTALHKDDKRKGNYWFFQCECGKIKSIRGTDVKSGRIRSCGCIQKEAVKKYNWQPVDLTGKTFGNLTVLYRVANNADGRTVWHCKCACGNEIDILGNRLLTGNTTSCGCIKSKGNAFIQRILSNYNIPYKSEYQIKTEKGKRFYDFAILNENNDPIRLIEFDGEQHFNENNAWFKDKENFNSLKARDQEKNNWAKEHNIPLVRIPYWERDKITLDMLMGDQYLIK